jgi:DNA-binding response OmpR family regulator
MDGQEALAEMRRIRGDVRVILASGYTEEDAAERFAGRGLAGFIQKPFRMGALLARLHDVPAIPA